MKVFYTTEVVKIIEKLNYADQARLTRTRKFFEEYGLKIGPKYVKKITRSGLWELRAGNIRLFLCIKESLAFGVHLIKKKSQKLPLNELRLAEKRCQQL